MASDPCLTRPPTEDVANQTRLVVEQAPGALKLGLVPLADCRWCNAGAARSTITKDSRLQGTHSIARLSVWKRQARHGVSGENTSVSTIMDSRQILTIEGIKL